MYEIKSKQRMVNGRKIETWQREVVSANMLEVETGTNGYQGGDSGHGSRTYFRIADLGGTDMDVKAIPNRWGGCDGFEVALGGDCELETFIEALKFAVSVLEDQAKEDSR